MRATIVATGLVAILALANPAVMPASAATSPEILFETGSGLPVTLIGESTSTAAEWHNAAGTLTATGLKFGVEFTTSNHEGIFETVFENVKKNTESCSSTGIAGEVRATGTLTLVYDITSSSGGGALLNMPTISILCGSLGIKLLDKLVALIKEVNVFRQFLRLTLQCSATVGEPAYTKYWESGVESTALYLMNFGSGYKKACILVGSSSSFELPLTASKRIELDA